MNKDVKKTAGNPNWVAGNYSATSLPTRLSAMAVGESLSQLTEYDLAKEKVPAITKKQVNRRSTLRAGISRAVERSQTEMRFEIEEGSFVTTSNKMFCALIVKRVQ